MGKCLQFNAIIGYFIAKESVKRTLALQMIRTTVLSQACGNFGPFIGSFFKSLPWLLGHIFSYFQDVALVMGPNSEFSEAHIY